MLAHMVRSLCIMALTALLLPTLALAQTPSEIGSYKKWSAYKLKQDKGRSCYMASQPTKSLPEGANRDPIWLFVTHRTSDKTRDEVSFQMGYPLKEGASVKVTIDGKKSYTLFAHGATAWAETREIDRELVTAMRKGSRLRIKGTSKRGTNTSDDYSLSGFTAAHRAIGKACPGK